MTTPVTDSVSGWTGSEGVTFTVNGSSLLDIDKTNWDTLFKTTEVDAYHFNGANIAADGYTGSPSPGYSTSAKLMASSARGMRLSDSGQYIRDPDTGSGIGSNAFQIITDESKSSTSMTEVYWMVALRYDFNTLPDQDWKHLWCANGTHFGFWQPTMAESLGVYNTEIDNWGIYASGYNGEDWLRGDLPYPVVQNQWHIAELHYTIHGTGPYSLEMWFDNQSVFSRVGAGQGVTAGISPNPGGWGREWFTNYFNTNSAWDATCDVGAMVCSGSRVRPFGMCEITSGSNYGATSYAAGTRVFCAPVLWSDTASQYKARVPSGGGPYYLWITNNKNERSAGLALDGGSPPAGTLALFLR